MKKTHIEVCYAPTTYRVGLYALAALVSLLFSFAYVFAR